MRGDRHVCKYIWGNSASLNWMEQAIFRRIHFLIFDSKIKVYGQTRYMRWIYGDKKHFSKRRSPLVRSVLELINPGVGAAMDHDFGKDIFSLLPCHHSSLHCFIFLGIQEVWVSENATLEGKVMSSSSSPLLL